MLSSVRKWFGVDPSSHPEKMRRIRIISLFALVGIIVALLFIVYIDNPSKQAKIALASILLTFLALEIFSLSSMVILFLSEKIEQSSVGTKMKK